jgi:uncharacterized protein (TIGR00661 family)
MKKKILIAPLNWGLGHATRCIPIIKALEENGFEPIIASDGVALALLKKEFPNVLSIELPAYNIQYAEKGKNFKWKLALQMPKMMLAIKKEKSKIKKIIENYQIDGLISDNRLGVYSSKVPSVFITHQLNVLSGSTSWLTTKLHSRYISKFNFCWVPDVGGADNLSGKLGHPEKIIKKINYIGPLSRIDKKTLPIKYDIMVLLSGPEPQRTLLENKLKKELEKSDKEILFVKGIVESIQHIEKKNTITYYNYMSSEELETAFNESDVILCRSGYTTIMDLAKLEKKAFFIPTPGQYEQEYLAKKFKSEIIAPSCKQDKFKLSKLEKIHFYKGFKDISVDQNWKNLLSLFQGK